jgi:hypothetical protein
MFSKNEQNDEILTSNFGKVKDLVFSGIKEINDSNFDEKY